MCINNPFPSKKPYKEVANFGFGPCEGGYSLGQLLYFSHFKAFHVKEILTYVQVCLDAKVDWHEPQEFVGLDFEGVHERV
jgi:hypothetical protein